MASDDERIAKYFGNRQADNNDMIELPSGTYRGVLKGVLIFLLGISVILLIWQGFAWYYNEFFNRLLKFPYPLETLQQLWDYLFNGKMMLGTTIYAHLQASLTRWITAFLLATFLGLVLGMIIGYFSKIFQFIRQFIIRHIYLLSFSHIQNKSIHSRTNSYKIMMFRIMLKQLQMFRPS